LLGHFNINIFDDGWLQRDVSLGNIILLETPEKRDARTAQLCEGMLIDADHVIRRWDKTGIRSEHRSGTLPYLSLRLLNVWTWSDTNKIPHSVMDDLESFVWVILHVILLKVKFTRQEAWLQQLSEPKQSAHHSFRFAMQSSFTKPDFQLIKDQAFSPYFPVLRKLFTLSIEGEAASYELEELASAGQLTKDHVQKTCKIYYQKYLAILFDASESNSLPDSW
ncbi:hypothetical protein SISSUDRAFT_993475, partial [Sistotremastrum suecicum HHB10207 ss-3]